MSNYWYLASPYSQYPSGIQAAHDDICKVAGILLKQGINTFCPIAHTHNVAALGEVDPKDHSIWMPADELFMKGAIGCIVCEMDGWEISRGVLHEIEYFRTAGKPILYLPHHEAFVGAKIRNPEDDTTRVR